MLFLIFFSIIVYHRIRNIVPCTIQYDFTVYLIISGSAGSLLLHRLFSCCGERWTGVVVWGFLIAVAYLIVEHGSRVCGLQQLCCMGLAALQYVEFSQTRDRTCVPCTGRRILNHWTTREVLIVIFLFIFQGMGERWFAQLSRPPVNTRCWSTLPVDHTIAVIAGGAKWFCLSVLLSHAHLPQVEVWIPGQARF